MTTSSHERRAIISLVFAAALFSLGGVLIKLVDLPAFAVAGGRSAIAAIIILIYIRRPKFTWSATQIGCAVAYACTVLTFVIANKMTTAANAILLQYTAPVYIAILGAWFIGERTRLLDWITIVLVLMGMVLFLLDGLSAGNWAGNLVALSSAFFYALLTLLLRKQKNDSPFESVLLGNILTAVVGLPAMIGHVPSRNSIIGLLLLGIFQLGFAYVLFANASRYVTALEMVLVTVIEPILNPLWVVLMIGEKPSVLAMIGGVIVLGAVVGRGILSSRGQNKSATVNV
jgi:drug/metabolite transporter (DMT)-like permease